MSDENRQHILHGVWQVIASSGIAGVSVRAVAAAAGVSAGRVQHYFPTKTDLIRASAAEMLGMAAWTHPKALGEPSDPVTLDALLLHALVPAVASRPGVGVYYSYVAASVGDPWIAEVLAQARQGVIDAVHACLEAQGRGGDDPLGKARTLVLLADGATQAVFLGILDADEAAKLVREAL